MNSVTPRRNFEDPSHYLEHISDCLASGHEPFAPATIDELHAALEAFPEFARRWLPSVEVCRRIGIDHTIGQPIKPLTERRQDRLLVTLRDNFKFREAIRTLIIEQGAA